MKYDFDKQINRRNTNSLKWDVAENELPMWVADMDFQTAPEIISELEKRVSHGVFGYSTVPDEWTESYINWWENRHGYKMEKDWLIFSAGVVPTISSCVRKLTTPAENVVIMTPVYNIFFNSILNNGRNVLECPLRYNGGEYEIDFNDLKEKLENPQTSLLILCNPQNPGGKIWGREELEKIGELCYKNGVTVIADEIHCDITDPNCEYTPFASVSPLCQKISVTCIAPTKAFNIAGLQTSAVSVPDPILRHKVWRALNTDEVAEPNVFAVNAAICAFNKGGEWLDELREYLYKNKCTVKKYLDENISKLKLMPSKATYLLWLDCSAYGVKSDKLADFIRKSTGLFLSNGTQYGGNGHMFLRLNIACSEKTLLDGLDRLKRALTEFEKI